MAETTFLKSSGCPVLRRCRGTATPRVLELCTRPKPILHWAAATTNSGIHTTSTGTGNGTVNYTVDANGGSSPRVGAITGGNKTFTFVVNQAVALGVALDNTNLIWLTGADYPWFSTTAPAYD